MKSKKHKKSNLILNKKGQGLSEIFVDVMAYFVWILIIFLALFLLNVGGCSGAGEVNFEDDDGGNILNNNQEKIMIYFKTPVNSCESPYADSEIISSFDDDFTYLELINLVLKTEPKARLLNTDMDLYCRDKGPLQRIRITNRFDDKITNQEYVPYIDLFYHCTTDYFQKVSLRNIRFTDLGNGRTCIYNYPFNIIINTEDDRHLINFDGSGMKYNKNLYTTQKIFTKFFGNVDFNIRIEFKNE